MGISKGFCPKINLEPTESRELDIAFSLLGKSSVISAHVDFTSSDPILLSKKEDLVSEPGPGTFIPVSPKLSTHVVESPALGTGHGISSCGVFQFENVRFYIPNESPRDAWIATPSAPFNLIENCPEFLQPGIHDVEVRIILSEGEGFVANFKINSGEKAVDLDIDKKSIKIAQ